MMRVLALIAAAATLAVGPATYSSCAAQGGCCRVCSVGKACGDSCIARDKICHKGKGCACDG